MLTINGPLGRYIIVGGAAYVTEMLTLYSLRHVLGLSPVISVAISFWVGFVMAFTLQKLVTFQNYEKRTHVLVGQMLGYSLLVAWNYALTLIIVKLLSDSVSVLILRSVIIVIATCWNFVIYRQLFKQSPLLIGPAEEKNE